MAGMKSNVKSLDIVGHRGDGAESAWIPIATKARNPNRRLDEVGWVDIVDAPISRKAALIAEAEGRLLVACRYTEDYIEAVIQYRAPKSVADGIEKRR